MDRRRPQTPGSLIYNVIGITVLMNLLFLVLMTAMPLNSSLIAARIRTAYKTGDLGTVDYLPLDSRRGWHQYNDCVILQMLANEDSSRINRALAPIVYVVDDDWSNQCATLQLLVMGDVDRQTLIADRYARYWHGYLLPAAFALQIMELRNFRRTLALAVWLSLAILLGVVFRAGSYIKLAGMSIALVSMTVWAVPYFAPSLSHGPGDALLLLAFAGFIGLSSHVNSHKALVLYASVFGATVIFFEMGTGQLPTAAAWLMALTLAAGRDRMELAGREVALLVLMVVLAFAVSAIVTVTLKQILSSLIVEAGTGEQFLSHLSYYREIPASEEGWPGILVPFGRLIRKFHVLTFYNKPVSYGLIWVTAIIWLIAVYRGLRGWSSMQSRVDLLILVAAALIPVIWVFLLPRHTYIHAAFMVRMLVVLISLAPVTLLWPQSATKRVPSIQDGDQPS